MDEEKLMNFPFIEFDGLRYRIIELDQKFTEDFLFDCKYVQFWWERLLGIKKNFKLVDSKDDSKVDSKTIQKTI